MTEISNTSRVSILNGRMSHMCAVIGSNMYMIGGYHKGNNSERYKERDVTVDMSDVNIYSIRDATWSKVKSKGNIPNKGSGMCMTTRKQFIYAFGGLTINEASMREFSNTLHELNTETLEWKVLQSAQSTSSSDIPDRPSIRDKAAMIHYNNALWVFAGWGTRIDRAQPNSRFVPDMSHEFVGWNNELWKFDLTTLTWSSPECSGAAPSPRAAHTLTICSKDRAVLFGGRTREGRVSDLYILHLDSLRWEGPIDTGTGPEPRSLHTCTLLHNNKVLLLGGMNSQGDSVLAQWVLTTTPKPSWRRVRLCDEDACARTWHTTAAYQVSRECTELLVFGGSPDNIWRPDHKYWANMTRFFYGVKPLFELCLDKLSSQVSDECPQFADDIITRKRLLAAQADSSDAETMKVFEMDSISPTSAS